VYTTVGCPTTMLVAGGYALTKFVMRLAAAPLVVNEGTRMIKGEHTMIVKTRFTNS